MTREEKYPNTRTFTFHNANPRNRKTTDCVERAVSLATGINYVDVVILMSDFQCQTGYSPLDGSTGFNKFMERLGWVKHSQIRHGDNTKYTGKEFCNYLNRISQCIGYNNIIANIGGNHTVAFCYANGYKVFDTWDSTDGCVGNYWTKQ